MPALSWNEIRQNAILFSREWQDATEERAEAQSFWNAFFQAFGIRRKSIAVFEERVKSVKDTYHRIDLFLPGKFLVEHKSAGEALDKAESQAFAYIEDLFREGRQDEVPRYIVLCNFRTFALYDLEPDEQLELPLWKDKPYNRIEFKLEDLHSNIKHFAFLIGQKTHKFGEEDSANLEAAQIMADLHDVFELGGYPQQDLERLLVRMLFCLFAEDTGIFEQSQFQLYIENKTREDASNLGQEIAAIFDMLNTPVGQRSKHLDEDLNAFPYINGELFAERISLAGFNRDMRNRLIAACRFDWSRISPAIFGSLFQGIMDAKERRQIGAHYTSERDIMKLIRPLFLDELQDEFERLKKHKGTRRKADLLKFQEKLASLKFLDPACGCGNFLVISYRELRRLELECLKLIHQFDQKGKELELGEVAKLSKVDVDQFYGIEIGEWPARIAETALWLTDHQMNTELTLATGNVFQRIPLKASPHILCANALRMDWNDLLPAKECSYVLGNPPFIGKQYQTAEQKEDIKLISNGHNGTGVLDYVACWYFKSSEYINGSKISCAFVSTNSITQGEQVGILWSRLFELGIHIHFAHHTFSWQSEAKGAAHVHVVILGFAKIPPTSPAIYEYEELKGEPKKNLVSRINPYLVDGPFVWLPKRRQPICDVPEMNFGNMPNEGGHLILSPEERKQILRSEPELKPYILPLVGGKEFINGGIRYCFWLFNAPPNLLKHSKELQKRLANVARLRGASSRKTTNDLAQNPALFGEIRQPKKKYIAIPEVSSERRVYIPIGILKPSIIATNKLYQIPGASLFHLGVLFSSMHMGWVRSVAGRLKSDFQYSAGLVYNNFPWPESPTAAQRAKVEALAQGVLDTREKYLQGGATLADLYDPLTMPGDLLKAHQALDRAVDKCYRSKKFETERERVEYLFALYEKITSPLAISEPVKKKHGGKKKKSGQDEQD